MTPLDLSLAALFFSVSIAGIVWGVRWRQRNKRNVKNMRHKAIRLTNDPSEKL